MADDPLVNEELDRLRSELASYRQREMDDLQSALATARADANHYRSEAQRNAELGRKIALNAQAQIAQLKAEIDVLRKASAGAARGR